MSFTAPAHAQGQTVFGPEELTIGWWPSHLSFHTFTADTPGEGLLVVTKNTPHKRIHRGFVLLNSQFIPLRHFFERDDLVFEKKVRFRSKNYMMVFLRGRPGASITLEVKSTAIPQPPTVSISADPESIILGESAALSWTSNNADTVAIEPGIGVVDPSNSLTITPEETTTYTITATGAGGGTATASVTVTVTYPAPTVSISADPQSIQVGQSSTLTWSSTYADAATIDHGIGIVPTSGSTTVSPSYTTTYTITLTGPGGTASNHALVNVTAEEEPPETPESGYLDGWVFDAVTGEPLPGVRITLQGAEGAILTDEYGQFSFPTPTRGRYLLAAEKGGYAYGKRWVEVMSQRDMAVDPLYLMPLDSQVTTITVEGGTHQSADGKIELVIPEGAVSEPIQVITTDVVSSDSLPAPLPPTSLFTYCVNLKPEDATFDKPVLLRIKNYLNFPADTPIPVGFYDREEGRWLKHGMSYVTGNGEWVEYYIDHFSWYDCNSPGLTQRPPSNIDRKTKPRNLVCEEAKDAGKSRVGIKSGNLGISHRLPSSRSLGTTKGVELVYNSVTANPSSLIAFETEIDSSWTTVPPTITYNLRIEGNMVAARFIGDRDKAYWGYLFDGINGRGLRLPTGVYQYRLDLSYDYSTTYARANFFGGPALDSTGVPTREVIPYTTSLDDFIVINNQIASPLGAGWSVRELNRLHIQPDGNLILVEGSGNAQASFKTDDISHAFEADENTIALYHFEGRENTAIDETGNFEGTFYGEGHLVSEGKFGSGATFDGDGDYIRLGNVGAPPEGTVEAWVYFPKDPTANSSYCMISSGCTGYGNNWDDAYDLGVHYGWGGDLRFGIWQYPGGGWQWAASGVRPADLAGGWHHIAGTWGSKGVEIWIDGERKGFNAYTGGFQNPNYNTVLIGANAWTWNFNGIVDAFRISNIQRTPGMGSYSSLSDHSVIVKNPDDTYTRTLKDGTQIHFNAEGLHTSTVDRNGNTTTYSYNADGLLTSITDPVGLVTIFEYDGNSRLSSITDPAGRITQFVVDDQGNLVSITNPDGTTINYTYDTNHILVGKTDPRGFTTQYLYDDHDRISAIHTPDGGTVQYRPYDVQGLINDLPEVVGTFDNPAPLIRPSEIQASKTDAQGNTTSYQVNAFGLFDEVHDPLGRVTQQEFDEDGNPVEVLRPDESQILMAYDEKGNLLSITDPLGNVTSFTYEPQFNQVSSVTDPLGHITTFEYDNKGNLIKITDALDNMTNLAYDGRGLVTSITDPLGQISSFVYDDSADLISVSDPLGNATAFGYDTAGNLVSITDAEGNITYYEYDQHSRLVQQTDPLGGVTAYDYQTGFAEYGHGDRITSLTDARGNTTSFEYDATDRVIKRTGPLGYQEYYTYDRNGNLTALTDPNGNTITYEYNAADRLVKKILPDDVVTYGYDTVDNLISIADGDSSLVMTYDVAGRLITVTTGGGVLPETSIGYSYDANGNLVSMVDPEGGTTNNAYDDLNQLISLTNPQGKAIGFGYDALGRRTRLTMPHGAQVSYSYDAAHRLLGLVHQINGGTIANFSYSHDKVGNRVSMIDIDGQHNYGYDALYQLINATHPQPENSAETYTYDPTGNRLSSAQHPLWSYDADNRLLSFNGTTFTYDNNGNMISRADASGTTTYHYDAEDRLIGGNKSEGAVITYRYDPFGRRIEKNVNGTITRYLYDGENILYELDGSDTILARYTHGPGIDEPLIMEREGANYYYHADGLGSITHITDAAGNLMQRYVYSAFGQIMTQEGSLINPYTYTGREYDPESGLYYYRTRYYDAKIGRFLQTDPIGYAGGDVNLYAYVRNNPVILVDPSGEIIPFALIGAGAIIGGSIGGVIYALTVNDFTWGGFAGAVLAGAVAGGVGVVAPAIAGSVGLGTGILGTAVVNATAGLVSAGISSALDPCIDFTFEYAAFSAFFGALGGGIAQKVFPTTGMKNFGQVGFPRTLSGVIPKILGGSWGSNAIKSLPLGVGTSVGVGMAGPVMLN